LPDTIRTWLTEHVASYLEQPAADIDPDTSFVALGLDSMYSLALYGDLEEWSGCLLEPTVIWDYPTITTLARHLHAELGASHG
jgi:acyl carrier protein